jgi:long-subunit fatty acid transport protein
MNINPSIAYKVNDMVSLGAGISFAFQRDNAETGYSFDRVQSPAVGYARQEPTSK